MIGQVSLIGVGSIVDPVPTNAGVGSWTFYVGLYLPVSAMLTTFVAESNELFVGENLVKEFSDEQDAKSVLFGESRRQHFLNVNQH